MDILNKQPSLSLDFKACTITIIKKAGKTVKETYQNFTHKYKVNQVFYHLKLTFNNFKHIK